MFYYTLGKQVSEVKQTGYTQGDSDVISMPAGFHRHLVGKTLDKCLPL